MKKTNRKSFGLRLAVFILIAIIWSGCAKPAEILYPKGRPEGPKVYETIGYLEYPTDKLFILPERTAYAGGEMILKIPKLGVTADVMAGVGDADLKKGVGLFEQAQLPGISNSNVSIAGHRDIWGAEFLNIHKLGEKDLLILLYDDKEYVYEYEKTEIIDSKDWSFVYCGDYSKISLMSCDPIGTSLNRIIVVGRLIQVNEPADGATQK